MQSTYFTETPFNTVKLGLELGLLLKPGDTVLLFGELGSGKTHFVKGLAEGLGVDELIKSPTYAYVNSYPLKAGAVLHHYDLYRMESGADLTSLGFDETLHDPRAINVVEWADRLGGRLPVRYIRVDFLAESHARSISVDFIFPARLRDAAIATYYEKWQTPAHVRDHCKQVAHVAIQVARAFIRRGAIIDLNLVYTSAMLHDMCRVCDFKELLRDRFTEEVTDAKWEKWIGLRKQYAGIHHADIADAALRADGFDDTAEVIRLHKSTNLIDEPDSYDTPEKMIVYYADKRVKHTEIVDLAERFRDGRERYGDSSDVERTRRFDLVEKRTHLLEKTLFQSLDVEPTDVR